MSEAETIRVFGREFRLSAHAALRLGQRAVSRDSIIATITGGESFRYFHDGEWKDGYYDATSRVFVGVAAIQSQL